MIKFDTEEARAARLAMHGRILRCPVQNNPEDCPLHTVRQLPVEQRIAWLDERSDEEVVALFRQHIDCLDLKVATL